MVDKEFLLHLAAGENRVEGEKWCHVAAEVCGVEEFAHNTLE